MPRRIVQSCKLCHRRFVGHVPVATKQSSTTCQTPGAATGEAVAGICSGCGYQSPSRRLKAAPVNTVTRNPEIQSVSHCPDPTTLVSAEKPEWNLTFSTKEKAVDVVDLTLSDNDDDHDVNNTRKGNIFDEKQQWKASEPKQQSPEKTGDTVEGTETFSSVPLMYGDNDEIEEEDEICGSEAGDDFHCTQLEEDAQTQTGKEDNDNDSIVSSDSKCLADWIQSPPSMTTPRHTEQQRKSTSSLRPSFLQLELRESSSPPPAENGGVAGSRRVSTSPSFNPPLSGSALCSSTCPSSNPHLLSSDSVFVSEKTTIDIEDSSENHSNPPTNDQKVTSCTMEPGEGVAGDVVLLMGDTSWTVPQQRNEGDSGGENRLALAAKDNKNLTMCCVCGKSLTHIARWKNRMSHIKRCANQHGVEARNFLLQPEEEDLALMDGRSHRTEVEVQAGGDAVTHVAPKDFMGKDASIAASSARKATTAAKVASNDDSLKKAPPSSSTAGTNTAHSKNPTSRSALDMLMAGAKRMASFVSSNKSGRFSKRRRSNIDPNEEVEKLPTSEQSSARTNPYKKAKVNGEMVDAQPFIRQKPTNGDTNQSAGSATGQSGSFNPLTNLRWSTLPPYKKISGTNIVVDGFGGFKSKGSNGATPRRSNLAFTYFLTHFHADHYGGLSRNWNQGTIYCSIPTANLVHQQLGVKREYLHGIPLNTITDLQTTTPGGAPLKFQVTLLDANHCPGAAMLLFEVGKKSILHVGDFRWNRSVMLTPETNPLRSFATGESILHEIYLDTTYCNPNYKFPSQEATIAATVDYAVEQVEEAQKRQQEILLLFGSYTIGKERIYLAVARRLGKKIYVDPRRYRILSQLEWGEDCMKLLTTKSSETNIWVVPLGHINMKRLPTYTTVQVSKQGNTSGSSTHQSFDRVIGFRPTGWTMSKKTTSTNLVQAATRGNVTSCGVPYSEHSSFTELLDCIDTLKPRKIIPTVSVSKSRQQVDLLLHHLSKV